MNQTVELDADTSVQLVESIPDFVVRTAASIPQQRHLKPSSPHDCDVEEGQ